MLCDGWPQMLGKSIWVTRRHKARAAAKDVATDEVEPAAETVAEEKEWILQEERSAGLHSSHQAIRIGGNWCLAALRVNPVVNALAAPL